MKRTYTQVEIDQKWPEIWNNWPNKENENASRKAFSFLLKSGDVVYETFELACNIYIEETRCDTYHKKLTTFIHEDVWKDVIDGAEEPEKYYERKRADVDEARLLIKTWNETARSHWAQVYDTEARIPIALKALQNEVFKTSWKLALDKAAKIFQYKPREGDTYSKLRLTLKWFCDTDPIKFTVLRLLEGEYGEPPPDITKKYPPRIEHTEEELKLIQEENAKLFKEVFGHAEKPKGDDPESDTKIQWF